MPIVRMEYERRKIPANLVDTYLDATFDTKTPEGIGGLIAYLKNGAS